MNNSDRGGDPLPRRSFLRQAGLTMLVGAGLVASGAAVTPAHAAQRTCCRDSTCAFCPGTKVRYRCQGCGEPDYCVCRDPMGSCYDELCP